MAAQPVHDDGRKVNVKLIVLGILAAVLVLFALAQHPRGGRRLPPQHVEHVADPRDRDLGRDRVRAGLPYEGAPGRSSLERLTAVAGSVSVTGSTAGPRPARVKMQRGHVADAEHDEAAHRVEEVVVGGDARSR